MNQNTEGFAMNHLLTHIAPVALCAVGLVVGAGLLAVLVYEFFFSEWESVEGGDEL